MNLRQRALASLMNSDDEEKIKATARKMPLESDNSVRESELNWEDMVNDRDRMELLDPKNISSKEIDAIGETSKDLEKLNELIDAGLYLDRKDQKNKDDFKDFSTELLKRKINKRF